MPYTLRIVSNRKYLDVGIPYLKEAQDTAKIVSGNTMEDILIINDDDNAVLYVAVYDPTYGVSHLSICTTGAIDDPSSY